MSKKQYKTQLTQPTEKHSSPKEATDRWYNNTYDWVKDKYGDASTWCKGHKQDLKRGTIYAYGAGTTTGRGFN
jgi:hypothetical protein